MARTDRKNSAEYWRPQGAFEGISLMHANFHTHNYPPHRHDEIVIAVTERGGSVVNTRSGSQIFTRSHLLVLDATEVHATRMGDSRQWQYRAFYINATALCTIAERLGLHRPLDIRTNMLADPQLVNTFWTLHRSFQERHDTLLQSQQTSEAFNMLITRHSDCRSHVETHVPNIKLFRDLTEYIQENLDAPITLGDLGRLAGLSDFQVIRLFRRVAGLTPHSFVTQLRVDRAADLLKRGCKVAEIAPQVGFYDQSALTKHFKRCFGITPLKFALALRG